MPAPRRTPAKAPGKNIEDWQRKTERVTLRLRPEVMQQLYSLSTELSDDPGSPIAYAEVVTQALAALNRELDAEVEENEQATAGMFAGDAPSLRHGDGTGGG